jgi:hypothetical protein
VLDVVVTVEVEISCGLVVGGPLVVVEELVELLVLVLVDVLSVELVELLVLVDVLSVELVELLVVVDVLSVELVEELVLLELLVLDDDEVLVDEEVLVEDEVVELVDVVRDVVVDELVLVVVVLGRVQLFRQPSLSFEFPSSHCSQDCLIPSPQNLHCPHELPTGRQAPWVDGGLTVLASSSVGNLNDGEALASHVSTAGSFPSNLPSPQTCARAGPAPTRRSAMTNTASGAVTSARLEQSGRPGRSAPARSVPTKAPIDGPRSTGTD